ncbi:hypothetical protein HDE_08322 [Halotydeus destructor]|nr:hypothetical protein HDE_08322 [Halotydeus destructor]
MTPSIDSPCELWDNLRSAILFECAQNEDKYDQRDIISLINDTNQVKVYTDIYKLSHEENVQNALETLQWRKSFGYHDLNIRDIPEEYYAYLITAETKERFVVLDRSEHYRKVSQWSEIFNKYTIICFRKAEQNFLTTGKKTLVVCDISGLSMYNYDPVVVFGNIQAICKYFLGIYEPSYILNVPYLFKPLISLALKAMPTKYSRKIVYTLNSACLLELFGKHTFPVDIGGTNTSYSPIIEQVPEYKLTTDEIGAMYGIKQSNVDKFKRAWNDNLDSLKTYKSLAFGSN